MPWSEPGPLLIFLVAATVLAVTPGPGMTYVLARAVAGGRGEGLGGAPALGQFVALGLVCVLLNTSVDVIVVLGASRLLADRRATLGRWLTAGSGCTLVGLGAYVALSESRR